jgi:Tfp pilus assembly protein FimT
MVMLLIVFSVAMPTLKGFFHGRELNSEARRFLSLTRHGQSRAVSEGVPMVLWIDAQRGAYGLQQQAGYDDIDSRAVQFELKDDTKVEAQMPLVAVPSSRLNQPVPGVGNVPRIRFTPDGFIGEVSPDRIVLRQGEDEEISIVQSTNRLKYEIQSRHSPAGRR